MSSRPATLALFSDFRTLRKWNVSLSVWWPRDSQSSTEELVALHEEPEPGSDQPKVLRARSTPLPALSTRLSDAFDTRVKVTRGAKKGRITIEFAGDDDLARIVGALAPGTSLDEE